MNDGGYKNWVLIIGISNGGDFSLMSNLMSAIRCRDHWDFLMQVQHTIQLVLGWSFSISYFIPLHLGPAMISWVPWKTNLGSNLALIGSLSAYTFYDFFFNTHSDLKIKSHNHSHPGLMANSINLTTHLIACIPCGFHMMGCVLWSGIKRDWCSVLELLPYINLTIKKRKQIFILIPFPKTREGIEYGTSKK